MPTPPGLPHLACPECGATALHLRSATLHTTGNGGPAITLAVACATSCSATHALELANCNGILRGTWLPGAVAGPHHVRQVALPDPAINTLAAGAHGTVALAAAAAGAPGTTQVLGQGNYGNHGRIPGPGWQPAWGDPDAKPWGEAWIRGPHKLGGQQCLHCGNTLEQGETVYYRLKRDEHAWPGGALHTHCWLATTLPATDGQPDPF